MARAQKELRIPSDALTVCLVTDAEMARWNRAYRGKPKPTDVLSFRAETGKPKLRSGQKRANGDAYLGDIAIAPAVARRNAEKFGCTFEDEMRILILHGALHLLGYDHETDNGQMDRREKRLRTKLGLA